MFQDDIYEGMLDNDELWYVYVTGSAMLISDGSLMDN